MGRRGLPAIKLAAGGSLTLNSLACPSPGHCVADGDYFPAGIQHPYLVSEP